MQKPTPPCEHTCWRKSPADWDEYDRNPDIGTERTCPACQWLAGVEWLRAMTRLPVAAIEEGVVTLMWDVCAAVWQAHRESNGLDILDERIRAQEDNLARIFAILAQTGGGPPPAKVGGYEAGYKAGYDAARGILGRSCICGDPLWLHEGVDGRCLGTMPDGPMHYCQCCAFSESKRATVDVLPF